MWRNINEEPIQTYGMDGKIFILYLQYHDNYGYTHEKKYEIIEAKWSSLNECFFEIKTKLPIKNEDIVKWNLFLDEQREK